MERPGASPPQCFKITGMRTLLLVFKHLDWTVSVALISYQVYNWPPPDLQGVVDAYLIVGAWQVLSMIVHHIWLRPRKHSTRYVYHWLSLIGVVTLPLGSYWVLAVISPLMAVFYTILCITEAFSITKH